MGATVGRGRSLHLRPLAVGLWAPLLLLACCASPPRGAAAKTMQFRSFSRRRGSSSTSTPRTPIQLAAIPARAMMTSQPNVLGATAGKGTRFAERASIRGAVGEVRGEWMRLQEPLDLYGHIKACRAQKKFTWLFSKERVKHSEERVSHGKQVASWGLERLLPGGPASAQAAFQRTTARFLSALGRRNTLLIIGDSHMASLTRTLVCILRAHTLESGAANMKNWKLGHDLHGKGSHGVVVSTSSYTFSDLYRPIIFVRSETMGHRPEPGTKMIKRYLESEKPVAVVAGSGAHFAAHMFS